MKIGEYVMKCKLGESSLSTVWRAENIVSGKEVAVKQIRLSKLNKHLQSCLDCEIIFLSSVNHPNIIRLIDVFKDEECIFLILEFCDRGNLSSYIRNHGRVKEHVATTFMQQLGAGLEVLQAHHIVHRDLKPENILVSGPDKNLVLKIADFGLSRKVHPGTYMETVCGSPPYMAPESTLKPTSKLQVDMWSTGVILFELLNGYPPFNGRSNVQLLQNIKSCSSLPFSRLIISELHADSLDICSKLLSINPVTRMSFDEFYQHRFLRKRGPTEQGSKEKKLEGENKYQ
ncbi:hypothetical protein ACFE04_016988 [Oxalis oulophora]